MVLTTQRRSMPAYFKEYAPQTGALKEVWLATQRRRPPWESSCGSFRRRAKGTSANVATKPLEVSLEPGATTGVSEIHFHR